MFWAREHLLPRAATVNHLLAGSYDMHMAHSLIFGDNSTFRCHKAALPKFDDVDKLQLAPFAI